MSGVALLIGMVPVALLIYAGRHRRGRRESPVASPQTVAQRLYAYETKRGEHLLTSKEDDKYEDRYVRGLRVIRSILLTYPESRLRRAARVRGVPRTKPRHALRRAVRARGAVHG
ncbi:MAG TPA: hypothetical protein VGD46_02245 [Rhizobacter sp.]